MGINRIRINNFRSIKDEIVILNQTGINCLIGKNGVGKTTLINAIEYFYNKAYEPLKNKNIIDKKNPYVQKAYIELDFDFKDLQTKTSNSYIEESISCYDGYIIDDVLTLRLTQYKSGVIEWFPINDVYKVRKILNIFPMFVVRPKEINSNSWDELWDVVCDIAISGIKQDKAKIHDDLLSTFSEIYGDKYRKVIEVIENVFEDERIQLNQVDYKARFKNALFLNLGGESFEYDTQKVDYYSTGINALKFISLFVKLTALLLETARKDVTLIIDEPEISLHPQFIDELATVLSDGRDLEIMIATHSSHLVSELIKTDAKIKFMQVFTENGYTRFRKIEDIITEKDKYWVTDNEALSYFANGIVFVEGQTEIQVIQNKYLAKLYPELKKITVYNTNSNDSATKIIIPKSTNSAIPYRVIVDMDKILVYNKDSKKFKIKSKNTSVNPLGNKRIKEREKYYYYGAKKKKTYGTRKKIDKHLKNEFFTDEKNFVITNPNYEALLSDVKMYCREYNTIPLKTTIEGTIINKENLNIFMEWLRTYWGETKVKEYEKAVVAYDTDSKLAIIRCVFHGKLDSLKNYKETENKKEIKYVDEQAKSIIEKYKSGDKTDGWIYSFFKWYSETYLVNSKEENKTLFESHFVELSGGVKLIKYML